MLIEEARRLLNDGAEGFCYEELPSATFLQRAKIRVERLTTSGWSKCSNCDGNNQVLFKKFPLVAGLEGPVKGTTYGVTTAVCLDCSAVDTRPGIEP